MSVTMSEAYSILIDTEFKSLQNYYSSKQPFKPSVYKFENNVKIISSMPEVVSNILTVHKLSDYKREVLTNEITSEVKSNIEALCFKEVSDECISI